MPRKFEVPNVPVVFQETRKNCWHASALMIMGDKIKRLAWTQDEPLFRAFGSDPHGIRPAEFDSTLSKMGMERLDDRIRWDASKLSYFLQTRGALWCAGRWNGHQHVVVLVAVAGDRVTIHDPAPGSGRRTITMQELNNSAEVVACARFRT